MVAVLKFEGQLQEANPYGAAEANPVLSWNGFAEDEEKRAGPKITWAAPGSA